MKVIQFKIIIYSQKFVFVFTKKYIRPVYIKFKGGQSLHNPLCISSYKLYKNIKVLKIIKCRTALQGTRMIEETLNFNRKSKRDPTLLDWWNFSGYLVSCSFSLWSWYWIGMGRFVPKYVVFNRFILAHNTHLRQFSGCVFCIKVWYHILPKEKSKEKWCCHCYNIIQ